MSDTIRFPPSTSLGTPGECCPACGAALADDQRYCLNCGVRRAGSRVPFPPALGGDAPAGAGAGASAPAPVAAPKAKRSWADRDLLLPVLGSSLLAIAVGILIGRSGASDTINTKAPVVNVAPTAGASTAAPTGTTESASADADAAEAAKRDASSRKRKATTEEKRAPPANVSKDVLKDNAKASGKDYVNKSRKLPTEVSTGGDAPAKDDKPAGGGQTPVTIG